MPALIAPLVGFSLGVLFSWAAANELARSAAPLWSTRSLALVVLFAFVIFGPYCGYFLTFATDWSLTYLVDGHRVPSALLLLAVLADIGAVILGFSLGAVRSRQRKFISLLPLGSVPLALAAVLIAVFARRLAVAGTYAQVARGLGAPPLAGSPVGYAVLWFNVCLIAAVAFTLRELKIAGAQARG